MNFKVSRTFQEWNDASASRGDFSDNGFVYQDKKMSLKELIDEVQDIGFFEWSSSEAHKGIWLTQADPSQDIDDGTFRTESLHFTDELKPHQIKRVMKILKEVL